MAFTVRDLEDLIRLLDKHPAWMEALRQRMLTKDLLESPKTLKRLSTRMGKVEKALHALTESVAALTEAQRRHYEEFAVYRAETDRRFAELAEAQRRHYEELAAFRAEAERRFAELREEVAAARAEADRRFAELAEAQRRGYEEFAAYRAETDRRFAELAEAQRRHYEELTAFRAEAERRFAGLREEMAAARAEADRRFAELAEAQRRTEEAVQRMDRRLDHHAADLGELKPIRMELTFREKPTTVFRPLLRRAALLADAELGQRLEEAVEAGRITEAELNDARAIDLVVEGLHRREDRKLYLAVEVSWQGGTEDVQRAYRRAAILSRALEAEVWPVVGAKEMTAPARRMARQLGVWWVQDGWAFRPEEIPEEPEEALEL